MLRVATSLQRWQCAAVRCQSSCAESFIDLCNREGTQVSASLWVLPLWVLSLWVLSLGALGIGQLAAAPRDVGCAAITGSNLQQSGNSSRTTSASSRSTTQ